jgi:hypothetical protein
LATAPVPNGADPAAYAAEIGERLFELLLTDYLAAEQPGANSILSMLNVITTEHIAATPTRPSYVRTRFRWEELPKIVSDPAGLPARVYGWGEPDFNAELLLRHLSALAVGAKKSKVLWRERARWGRDCGACVSRYALSGADLAADTGHGNAGGPQADRGQHREHSTPV